MYLQSLVFLIYFYQIIISVLPTHLYTIQDIFNTFDIVNIEKTEKTGLEQIQDEI